MEFSNEGRARCKNIGTRRWSRHIQPQVTDLSLFVYEQREYHLAKPFTRHAMLVDQNTEAVTVPLNNALPSSLGRLELANSTWILFSLEQLLMRFVTGSLSEMAVLGVCQNN